MVNQTKVYEVENIKASLKEAKSAALVDYQGLTAEQVREMRQAIKEKGGFMLVAKNTLISIALENLGIKLDSPLTGPTALVLSQEDEIAPLKVVDETKRQFEKPEFKAGIFEGKLISLPELEQLIKLPGRETLLAQFVNGLTNPLQRFALAGRYHQTKLVLTLKALSEKEN